MKPSKLLTGVVILMPSRDPELSDDEWEEAYIPELALGYTEVDAESWPDEKKSLSEKEMV